MADRYRTRRRVLATAACTGLAVATAGCQAIDGGSGEPTALVVGHNFTGGEGGDAMTALLDAYRAEHPDRPVEEFPIADASTSQYRREMAAWIEDGDELGSFLSPVGNTLSWYGDVLGDAGESVWEPIGLADAVGPVIANACAYEGRRVAVPSGAQRVSMLYYDPEAMAAAGVDSEGLADVADLLQAVEALSEHTDVVPLGVPLEEPLSVLVLLESILLGQAGLESHRAATDGRPDRDAIRRAVETAGDLVPGHTFQDAATVGLGEAIQRFVEGETAMMVAGSWLGSQLEDRGQADGEGWAAQPFPATGDTYPLSLQGFTRPATTPSGEATREWLTVAGSRPGQRAFNGHWGSVPVRDDVDTTGFDPRTTAEYERFRASTGARTLSLARGTGLTVEQYEAARAAVAGRFADGELDVDAVTEAVVSALS